LLLSEFLLKIIDMNKTSKQTIFSGIKPSGNLHLGNYLGAIKQWVAMQENNNCIFCVVDYHAITVPQDPKELAARTIEIAKIYIAAGIDPKKSIIFKQSDIKEHAELAWILNCTTARMSDLQNMTQYKDKAINYEVLKLMIEKFTKEEYINSLKESFKKNVEQRVDQKIGILDNPKDKLLLTILKNERLTCVDDDTRKILIKVIFNAFIEYEEQQKNIGVGLFDYPVLMAADILLYDTDVVPVGEDQIQHVELTRDLAKRFNHNFGETFKIPKAETLKEGARIMGLENPLKKMSKSEGGDANCIYLLDDPEKAAKKIMKATTDSEGVIKYDKEKKPGISNLLTIYSLLADRKISDIEAEFAGKQYGEFKVKLAEIVKNFLTKFQLKYHNINNDAAVKILGKGGKTLQKLALKKINLVKKNLGINL
jgi:tryptophanyl-tRNA synthetase